jgi:huntingtin-interacting protein 1-related protein
MSQNSARLVPLLRQSISFQANCRYWQEPPNLFDNEGAPDLPARPTTAAKSPTPPPAAPVADEAAINEQARLLKQYEDQQAALRAQQEAEERRRQELERQQQMEFEQRQREQQERERLALEQLQQQQLYQLNNQAAQRVNELERELLAARGQFERDQLLLEQYDRVGVWLSSSHTFFDNLS